MKLTTKKYSGNQFKIPVSVDAIGSSNRVIHVVMLHHIHVILRFHVPAMLYAFHFEVAQVHCKNISSINKIGILNK